MYICIYIYISHYRSGNSHGQEMFLAPPVVKQTCNYHTECSNHHPSPSGTGSKGDLEVPIESSLEWDLSPRPLNLVLTL